MAQYIEIDDSGNKFWFKDKEMEVYHREDGPAVEGVSGYKAWYKDGRRHRKDGPAIEWSNGEYKEWCLNGVRLSEAEFNAKMNPVKELTVAEIEKLLGYKVKVVK